MTWQLPRRSLSGRVAALVATAALALTATGCGAGAEAGPGGDGASPVAPRSLVAGPASAEIADPRVVPVSTPAQPLLPVTVQSHDGSEVTVADVDRILAVDLYGTLAEIVFALGLGDRVVGRDTSTGFPEAADLPVVTAGGHDLNAEAVLDLDPTVVLTDATIGPTEVLDQLRAAGIPVVMFTDERTLEGVPDHVRAVAAALGVPAAGEAVIDRLTAEIEQARAQVPAGVAPRVVFLYIRGSAGVYLMGGPGSGVDSMIEAIGGVDVGTDIGLDRSFTPVTSEQIIAAAPDVVLVMTEGLESMGGVDGLLRLPGLQQTPAGQARRIVDMPDTQLLAFGPRSGRTVQALAEALYQE